MTVQYIVVGYSNWLLVELENQLPADSVLVFEESALIDARDLSKQASALQCVHSIVPAPIQRDDLLDEVVARAAGVDALSAVLPGVEYSVVAAAAIAEGLGLPGASLRAARSLRDKGRLREAVTGYSVRQPDWTIVRSVNDVTEFRKRHGGRCVLKPANRQSSLGVQRLGPDDDLDVAWRRTTQADEPHLQGTPEWVPDRYLAEEQLDGREISVEAVVHRGEIVFVNITDERVLSGRHPVEVGHVVPAALADSTQSAVVESMFALAAATGFNAGILHAEWILVNDTEPHLVECAGRLPGDDIVTLVDLAYGGSLVADWMAVLRGEAPTRRKQTPQRGAAVRFLESGPGLVTSVTGADDARALGGVHSLLVQTTIGETLHIVESSWDRPGRVVVSAEDGPAAQRLADHAATLVHIVVAPSTAGSV